MRRPGGRRAALCLAALLLVSCSTQASVPTARPVPAPVAPNQPQAPAPGGTIRSFELVAEPARVELKPGLRVMAWTYNATVPGPPIRARVGDLVRVTLVNHLPEATSLHFHGLALPNAEDGVAGVTQDAVPPGAAAEYAFVAAASGTYWYHSATRSRDQVDRGLYGALIVDPAGGQEEPPGTVEATLIYDEWPLGLERASPPPPGDLEMDSYVTDSVDGRTGSAISPIRAAPGTPVHLRLINAGFDTHFLRIDNTAVSVTAFDGRAVTGGPSEGSALPLGSGQRLDVSFPAPDHLVWLRVLDGIPPADEVPVPIAPRGVAVPARPAAEAPPNPRGYVDFFAYPAQAKRPLWPAGAPATRIFSLELGEAKGASSRTLGVTGMRPLEGRLFTVNGKVFPATGPLVVRFGDLVRLDFVNASDTEHAMYLHGHSLQLLSLNGSRARGAIVLDTVLVPPLASVSVGFVADNPGWWLLLCQELDHAAAGLMTLVVYEATTRLAQLDRPAGSTP